MAPSLTGNYAKIQHQCKHNTSHWKSVWQGPECSPVQWQHRRLVQNYIGVGQWCLLSPTLFNIFLERIICEALDDQEGSVSIGGRLITNFCFADDIVVLCRGSEEEADILVVRLDRYNVVVLYLCFIALRHFSGHFWRSQLTYPLCSWASLLGSLPVLSAHFFRSN